MRDFFRGFWDLLKRLVFYRRYRIMILLLVIAAFLTMEVYRTQVVSELKVVFIDLDNSQLSRTLYTLVDASREVEVVHQPILSVEQAQSMLTRGDIAGVVLIPNEFSVQIKQGAQARLLAALDMSNVLIGKNVQKAISRATSLLSAGIQIEVARKLGASEERALASIAPITVAEDKPFNPFSNYTNYVVPGLVLFLLNVFLLLLTCSVFRQDYWPGSIKGACGAFGAIYLVGLLFGFAAFYLYLPHEHVIAQSSFWLLFASLSVFLLCVILMAIAINTLIAKPFVALELTVVIGMMSLMLSGITWPTDMFPPVLQSLAYFVPMAPFAQGFQMFLHHPMQFSDLADKFAQSGYQVLFFSGLIGLGIAFRQGVRWIRRANS